MFGVLGFSNNLIFNFSLDMDLFWIDRFYLDVWIFSFFVILDLKLILVNHVSWYKDAIVLKLFSLFSTEGYFLSVNEYYSTIWLLYEIPGRIILRFPNQQLKEI